MLLIEVLLSSHKRPTVQRLGSQNSGTHTKYMLTREPVTEDTASGVRRGVQRLEHQPPATHAEDRRPVEGGGGGGERVTGKERLTGELVCSESSICLDESLSMTQIQGRALPADAWTAGRDLRGKVRRLTSAAATDATPPPHDPSLPASPSLESARASRPESPDTTTASLVPVSDALADEKHESGTLCPTVQRLDSCDRTHSFCPSVWWSLMAGAFLLPAKE